MTKEENFGCMAWVTSAKESAQFIVEGLWNNVNLKDNLTLIIWDLSYCIDGRQWLMAMFVCK